METPGASVVCTVDIGPGNMHETSAAADIAPRSWAGNYEHIVSSTSLMHLLQTLTKNMPRVHGSLPAVHRPRVT